ncbi:replication fork protection component Swi3-domain-containing protein [Corynascus similis CBS 632.67]
MPSKTASNAGGAGNLGQEHNNFVDDYLADWDDDPFRSPSPDPAKNDKPTEKKADVLGIEKELDLKKKPRAPRVKLDETRLLSDKGIPKLRKMAPKIRFKGKGHEFSDAARLLSFYQEWLDDLFPKATFLDALAMVEKTGHKTTMRNARLNWIDETKPRATTADFEEDNRIHQGAAGPRQPDRVAPIFDNVARTTGERTKTPGADDLFGDDDIYNSTPVRHVASSAPSRQAVTNDVPDEDDLDALMAEADAGTGGISQQPVSAPPFQSIFGNGSRRAAPAPILAGEPDDDDLDALMAEAEAEAEARLVPSRPAQRAVSGSISGDGKPKQPAAQETEDDGDDLDALMAEAEAETRTQGHPQRAGEENGTNASTQPTKKPSDFDDDDDLDALMAEQEAEAGARAGAGRGTGTDAAARPSTDTTSAAPLAATDAGQKTGNFDDDEEVMAEMDGLW